MTARTTALVNLVARLSCSAALAFVALLAPGCSSTPPPRERLSFEQLAEAEREGIEAVREGGERWQRTLVAAREDERLARFLAENLAVELVRQYERGALARMGDESSPYERARRALLDLGAPAAELLANMVAEGDDVVAGVGADALWPFGALALSHVFVLVRDERGGVRRRAFEVLGRIGPVAEEDEARIADVLRAALESDPEWVVRSEAARAAGRRFGPHVPSDRYTSMLALALEDADPAVVGRAADALVQCGDPRAVPALVEAVTRTEADPREHTRVQRALRSLLRENADHTRDEWWRLWLERREALLAPLLQSGERG
jgi:HEAT repeat protein